MINDLHAQNELTEKTAKFLANLRARSKTKKKQATGGLSVCLALRAA